MTLTQSEKITFSIVGVILIVLLVLVSVLLTSHSYQKEQSQQFKELIAAKDSSIAREKLEREALLIAISESNKTIQSGKASAEVSLNKVAASKPFYQDNTKKYENIPVIVHSMSNDSLQSAINRYYQDHP